MFEKKMGRIQRKAETVQNMTFKTIEEARQIELEHIKMDQRLCSYLSTPGLTDEEGREFLKIQHSIRKSMEGVSRFLIDEKNRKNDSAFTWEEIVGDQKEWYYRKGGEAAYERSEGIRSHQNEYLSAVLPKHPKDAYPLARAIKRSFIIHAGPTNSGKTHQAIESFKAAETGVFLSPLRLLALEIFERVNEEGVFCDLLTGEEEVLIPFARHAACTIEKLAFDAYYDVAVVDEGQMLADPVRGAAWTAAILGVPANEIHVCCSVNAASFIEQLARECGDDVEIVSHERQTPLIVEGDRFHFPGAVQRGDALIAFSRAEVLEVAANLSSYGVPCSVVYGDLPPAARRKQVVRFLEGETKVVVATDAIGMGLNLPIRRIVFLKQEKYDGSEVRPLTTQETKQIAGRAGRKGMYEKGLVVAAADAEVLASRIAAKDLPVKTAYLSPEKSVIEGMPHGSLETRLDGWMRNPCVQNLHFKKADLSLQLELLRGLDPALKDALAIPDLFKALHIPFDADKDELVEMWVDALTAFAEGRKKIKKPAFPHDGDLLELELHDQKVGLYYAIVKTLGFEGNLSWVADERAVTADAIHLKLVHAFS